MAEATSVLRSLVSKSSSQAFLALLILGTGCFLAIRGDISGEMFMGVMLAIIAWLYPKSA